MWQLIFSDLSNIGLGKRNDVCIGGFIFTLFAINLVIYQYYCIFSREFGICHRFLGVNLISQASFFSMSHTEFPPRKVKKPGC